ncbi:alpha/beta hydrolase [Arthrobacter psychrolactophilus]
MVQSFRSPGHGELARIGVAVCHGFTGSPVSMQGWSESLANAGFAVNMPLLAGHGTTWQDLAKTPWEDWYRDFEAAYLELAARCDMVYVAGLSMGGALALRVAALHPVAGVAVVNPGLTIGDPKAKYAGLLKYVVKSVPAIGNDMKIQGVSEGAYPLDPHCRGSPAVPTLRQHDRAAPPRVGPNIGLPLHREPRGARFQHRRAQGTDRLLRASHRAAGKQLPCSHDGQRRTLDLFPVGRLLPKDP